MSRIIIFEKKRRDYLLCNSIPFASAFFFGEDYPENNRDYSCRRSSRLATTTLPLNRGFYSKTFHELLFIRVRFRLLLKETKHRIYLACVNCLEKFFEIKVHRVNHTSDASAVSKKHHPRLDANSHSLLIK